MKLFQAFEEQPIQGDTSVTPEQDIWQDDLVVPPGDTEPSVDLQIVTPVDQHVGRHDQMSDEDLFGANIVPGQLPDIKANIAMVEEDKVKVANLKDLEATITTRGAVSRDDAIAVEEIFGDFITQFHSPSAFSRAPSRVNYDQTNTYMVRRIAAEEETASDHVATTVKMSAEFAKELAARAETKLIPALLEQIGSIRECMTEHPVNTAEAVIPMSGAFINVLTTQLRDLKIEDLNFDQARGDAKAKQDIASGLAGLAQRLSNNSIYIFLEASGCAVTNDTTIAALHETHFNRVSESGFMMNAKNILSFYAEGNLEKLLKCVQKSLDTSSTYLLNLQTRCGEVSGNYEQVSDLMRGENGQFERQVKTVEMADDILRRLPYINFSVGQLLTGFANLHPDPAVIN